MCLCECKDKVEDTTTVLETEAQEKCSKCLERQELASKVIAMQKNEGSSLKFLL